MDYKLLEEKDKVIFIASEGYFEYKAEVCNATPIQAYIKDSKYALSKWPEGLSLYPR